MYTVHPCACFHIMSWFSQHWYTRFVRTGHAEQFGVFCRHQSSCGHVMSTSLESRGVRVTVSPRPVFHGTDDWSSKMTDRGSMLFITKESYKRKEVRKQQEVVLIFQLLSELPTNFRCAWQEADYWVKCDSNTAAATSGRKRCRQCFMSVRVWERFQGRSSTSARETWTNENWVSFVLLCDAAVLPFLWWTCDRWEIKPHMANEWLFFSFLSYCNLLWQDVVVVADSYFPKVKYVNVLIWCILLLYSLLWFIISSHQNWNRYN